MALDSALLDLARNSGVNVRTGTVVRKVDLPAGSSSTASLLVSPTGDGNDRPLRVSASLIVGADGPASLVARAAGVYATSRRLWKSGITFHRQDMTAAPASEPMEGRFVFGRDWYVGIAPVPGNRVNVGMVVPPGWLRAGEPGRIAESVLDQLPGDREAWRSAPTTDHVTFAGRLEHHVRRVSGRGFLLVGDAIEFIDPLTGEGLHRAFVSAELGAEAIRKSLRGDRNAIADYDRRIRARFRSKNVVSWVLQAFLSQPQAFDYALRRLAARHPLRDQLTLVLTDQTVASSVVDPRFLLRLLAP